MCPDSVTLADKEWIMDFSLSGTQTKIINSTDSEDSLYILTSEATSPTSCSIMKIHLNQTVIWSKNLELDILPDAFDMNNDRTQILVAGNY